MILVSTTFSVMFYITSANALHLSTVEYQAPNVIQNGSQQLSALPRPMTTLQSQTTALKRHLIVQLALLNAGVLIVGGAISYQLARRTLRPMQQAMDMQQHFFFDASHELKTPLSALHLRGDVALRNPKLTLTEAKATIASNVEQIQKLEHLTHDLLQLAKSNHTTTNLQPVSLSTAADQATRQLTESATRKSMRIIKKTANIYASSDAQLLVQIIVILLDNAIKHGRPNSSIYIEGRRNKKEVILTVRDEGPGINAGDLPHIFERFYQGDQSRQREGFGLGLSIATSIARQLHGGIDVTSSPNGSVFSIHLPSPARRDS